MQITILVAALAAFSWLVVIGFIALTVMRARQGKKTRGSLTGWLMSLPYLAHFLFFGALPLAFSLLLVFCRWNLLSPIEWIGLKNFVRLGRDIQFYKALGNTLIFIAIYIPLQIKLVVEF